jgi:hypothetical protein
MRGGASIRLRMEQLLSRLADSGACTRWSTSRVSRAVPNAPDGTTPTLAVLAKQAGSRTVGGMPRCVPFVHTAVAVST